MASKWFHGEVCAYLGFMSILISVSASNQLRVKSDQPTILDSNVTFVAQLQEPNHNHYLIYWVENPQERSAMDKLNKQNNFTGTWSLKYPSGTFRPGTYAVTVTVVIDSFISYDIAVEVITYNITENYTGIMLLNQPGIPRQIPTDVSTTNETEVVVNLHDPSNFLSNATTVTWSWFNETSFIVNTTASSLKTNFTREGNHYVNVSLIATYEEGNKTLTKHGFFETNVTAKVPIVNFTMNGDAWIPHGKLLNLHISCDGTTPYRYCWWIKTGLHNKTGNETCDSEEASNQCLFGIVGWYFHDPGIYSLFIVMSNDVSHVVNRTMINVYKVARKQPLSIIVVPISCTIIALVIIIFGVAYFWENHTRYTVEVADFDFGQNDELPYMTFYERLRDALSTGTNTPRLLLPPDDEPILS